MSSREDRLARFHRIGPIALVVIVGGVALLISLLRSHKIDRFEVLYFIALIPTIILHEVSHGVVANWFGDDTAKRAGRLTLNPLKHVDPIGTLVLPIFLLLAHFPAFGYAKPVPVAVNRLRHPRNQSVLVSLAGPATNLILATISGVIVYFWIGRGVTFDPALGEYVKTATFFNVDQSAIIPSFLIAFGLVNVVVGAFNLIPIPPLDGSAVLERLIPQHLLPGYYRLRQFSLIIVLFFVLFDQNVLVSLFNHVENLWVRLVLFQ
jgi:Zn-dependent protease